MGLPITRTRHVQVPKNRTNDIEADCVQKEENADEDADDLGDRDEVGRAAVRTALLDLIILAQAIEATEEADEDNEDAHLVNDLGDYQTGVDNDLLLV